VRLSGPRDDLDCQLDSVGPTRGGAQTGVLRFTVDIFVYKRLLLVIGEKLVFIIYWLPLVNRADQVQAYVK